MSLKGFQRVSLWAGQSKDVTFTITPEMMQMVDNEGNRIVEAGEFTVSIGGSAPMKRSEDLGASPSASGSFLVKGKAK